MSGERHGIALAIMVSLGALAPASAAWAGGGYDYEQDGGNWGGSVKACSLAGVNPVHHPEIFDNPAVAREFGFVRAGDGAWHVECSGARGSAAAQAYIGTGQAAPRHHGRTVHKPAGRVVKGE